MYLKDFDKKFKAYKSLASKYDGRFYLLNEMGADMLVLQYELNKWGAGWAVVKRKSKYFYDRYERVEDDFTCETLTYSYETVNRIERRLLFKLPMRKCILQKDTLYYLSFKIELNKHTQKYNTKINAATLKTNTIKSRVENIDNNFSLFQFSIEERQNLLELLLSNSPENIVLASQIIGL